VLPTSTSEDPLAPASPRPARPWLGFTVDAALAIVLLLVASTLLITPLVVFETMAQPPGASADDVLQAVLPHITVAAIVSMLLAALATWALRGRAISGELPRMSLRPALVWAVVAGVGIQAIVLGIDALLRSIEAPLAPSNVEPILALNRQWPWLAWLMVVVVGPFAEELLFRHVLLRRFAVAGRVLAGLLATSALFALMHELGQGADRGLAAWLGILGVYLAMGVGFGLVYLRTGRFWAAFTAHATCNATAMTLAAFST
jgi:hypothetical protein